MYIYTVSFKRDHEVSFNRNQGLQHSTSFSQLKQNSSLHRNEKELSSSLLIRSLRNLN